MLFLLLTKYVFKQGGLVKKKECCTTKEERQKKYEPERKKYQKRKNIFLCSEWEKCDSANKRPQNSEMKCFGKNKIEECDSLCEIFEPLTFVDIIVFNFSLK